MLFTYCCFFCYKTIILSSTIFIIMDESLLLYMDLYYLLLSLSGFSFLSLFKMANQLGNESVTVAIQGWKYTTVNEVYGNCFADGDEEEENGDRRGLQNTKGTSSHDKKRGMEVHNTI